MNKLIKIMLAIVLFVLLSFVALALPELIKLFCIAVIDMAETLDKLRGIK